MNSAGTMQIVDSMQQPSLPPTMPGQESARDTDIAHTAVKPVSPGFNGRPTFNMQEADRAAERARLRQGIMHVRIHHFYCTLEEMADPTLRGQPFVIGTNS